MALRVYDVEIDAHRDATQSDIDQMQAIVQAYGQLKHRIEQDHNQLLERLKSIRAKAAGALA